MLHGNELVRGQSYDQDCANQSGAVQLGDARQRMPASPLGGKAGKMRSPSSRRAFSPDYLRTVRARILTVWAPKQHTNHLRQLLFRGKSGMDAMRRHRLPGPARSSHRSVLQLDWHESPDPRKMRLQCTSWTMRQDRLSQGAACLAPWPQNPDVPRSLQLRRPRISRTGVLRFCSTESP
jgi:hypothetical protein